jgi:hypothetical protein
MPIDFQLPSRVGGISMNHALPGQTVYLRARELLGPEDADLLSRLEQLHAGIFSRIPQLPVPSFIDHLLVVIRRDLTATAYVNELNIVQGITPTRPLAAGTPVYLSDVAAINSVDPGVDVPADAAVVVVRSHSWRRSLYFDLMPLHAEGGPRELPIQQVLAQQAMLLHGLGRPTRTRRQHMEEGLALLKQLLETRCEEERQYQELLELHPWMLPQYKAFQRHPAFDDKRIPDFVATRTMDDHLDVVELKQPFLSLFKQDGAFAATFNDAWNQAETYLGFAEQQRAYLREEKNLRFENPTCVLLVGCGLTEPQLRKLREREARGRGIKLMTYDQLLRLAEHSLAVIRAAGEAISTADVRADQPPADSRPPSGS